MSGRPASVPPAFPLSDVGLPLGQILAGTQYRVLAKLGTGGMGTVYAAEHVALEKRVALKVLRADAAHSSDAIERLRAEARAASKIGNQFICDVTDFGQTPDGRVFFVMEYLEGNSLGKVLRDGPLLPVRAIPILRQIAKALEAAHEKGIVHLDMKPDNVMLLPRGRRTDAVKVVDFGVARLLGGARREDKVSGTPEYVSPERFLGASYDHRADIYALGVLAYETLTGSVPFRGPSYLATLTAHVEDAPAPLERPGMPGAIPPRLAALVLQMLEKDPGARPASMAVVEAMLCEAQIEAGLHTAWDDLELPAVDELWRKKLAERMPSPWGRQKKALIAGALAVALGGVSLAVYYGVLREPEVVIKYVAQTQTEEAEPVAAWLEKAVTAARAQRYTRPAEDSSLWYIQRAEAELVQLKGPSARSKGAEALRHEYASRLALVGDELRRANLGHLAVVKFKDALLFTPDDATLAAKAELSPDERARLRQTAHATASRPAARATPPAANNADDAKETAASAYMLAAGQARFSEARVALRALAPLDKDGVERARLADAFRHRADDLWTHDQQADAVPFYQLTSELDSADGDARRRGQWEPPVKPATTNTGAEHAAEASAAAAAAKTHKLAGEELRTVPRDPATSKAAARQGRAALNRLELGTAETAFNRALEADPTNVVAIGGLGEVAFERSRYTEALDYARRAAQLSPKSASYLRMMGDAYFKLLRFADAQVAYKKAAQLAPNDEVIRSRLQRLREKLRD